MLGRAATDFIALAQDLLFHLGRLQGLVAHLIEPRNDGRRCARGDHSLRGGRRRARRRPMSTDDAHGFPPVIVYTGRDLSQDEELRLRKYSKSIIVKGAKSPERLLDEVTQALQAWRQARELLVPTV